MVKYILVDLGIEAYPYNAFITEKDRSEEFKEARIYDDFRVESKSLDNGMYPKYIISGNTLYRTYDKIPRGALK